MPSSVTKFNLTVDDFDSLITYANQSHWLTPDPSAGPDPALDIWFDGTYHRTNVSGASFTFNFKGSQLLLYGAAGPAFGSYEIDVDGRSAEYSAHATQNSSAHILFSAQNLTYTDHTMKVTNLGARRRADGTNLLVDFIKATVDIAPTGASLANTTLQETDPRLFYTGNWTENVFNPAFSGGYSRYTNGDCASVSLLFHATAIFIFGDKTDRHGLYTVTLDDHSPQTFNGVSGCGGAFAHACEKDDTLAYFAANLDERQHNVTVRNIAGALGSYFDLDAIVLTNTSEYLREYDGREIFMEKRNSGSAHAPLPVTVNVLLFLFFLGVFLSRRQTS
ncbi:hypothetical protein B0H11DRAFT_2121137 [Mycena galericulata]|nr:hypothetical protein B0H11DRAFT_2121137 [Mycena galericulata]